MDFFGGFPLFAGAMFAAGLGLRYLSLRPHLDGDGHEPSDVQRFFGRHKVFSCCLILLLLGHAAQVFFPAGVLAWNSVPIRLYIFESLTLALSMVVIARFAGLALQFLRVGSGTLASDIANGATLGLLLASLISGVLVAVLCRWGSSWGALILGPYLVTVFRGHPLGRLAAQLPLIARLHVFSFFALMVVAPFSRAGRLVICLLHRSLASLTRPLSAGFKGVQAWLCSFNLASRIWPDED